MSLVDLRVDNLDICPEFDHTDETQISGILDDAESVILPTLLTGRTLRTFDLTWANASEGKAYLVQRAYEAVGRVGSVNYIPPDGTAIVECRMVSDLEIIQDSATSWSLSLRLKETKR